MGTILIKLLLVIVLCKIQSYSGASDHRQPAIDTSLNIVNAVEHTSASIEFTPQIRYLQQTSERSQSNPVESLNSSQKSQVQPSKPSQTNKRLVVLSNTNDFKTLVTESDIFVDNSLLIKDIIHGNGSICITRPMRTGKSLNLDMVRRFFELEVNENGTLLPRSEQINHKLFLGGEVVIGGKKRTLRQLEISKNWQYMTFYQGKFSIITLNLTNVGGNGYEQIKLGIIKQIRIMFHNHIYLKNFYDMANSTNPEINENKKELDKYLNAELTDDDIHYSVQVLCKLLREHFERSVHVLIDAYDDPINNAFRKFPHKPVEIGKVRYLLENLYARTLKGNEYKDKTIMTGLQRLPANNVFLVPNNVVTATPLFVEGYPHFDSFTQEVVEELLTKVPTRTHPARVKSWYNGYNWDQRIIYNPSSVMKCLANEGFTRSYWADLEGTEFTYKVFRSDEAQMELQRLAQGHAVRKELHEGSGDKTGAKFHIPLILEGLLNPIILDRDWLNPCYLVVPNREVQGIFRSRVIRWVMRKLKIGAAHFKNFVGYLLKIQLDAFRSTLEDCLRNIKYSKPYYAEDRGQLHFDIIGGILSSLMPKYIIRSDRETRSNRCTYLVIPLIKREVSALIIKCIAIQDKSVLEDTAAAEIGEVIEEQYFDKIRTRIHVQQIVKIVIVFCNNEVAIEHKSYEIPKS